MLYPEFINKVITQYISNALNLDFFSGYRDIFNARLDTFISQTKQYLVSALLGEIGNNAFDHNYTFQSGMPKGVFFDYMTFAETAILADYGRGIYTTLLKVRPDIQTDVEALRIALTEMISGRSPEQRGNGLKFVRKAVIEHDWHLYIHSGTAAAFIENKDMKFVTCQKSISGCLAILNWGKE